MRYAAILLPLSLAGCAADQQVPQTQIRTVTVSVPVRQPCVPATLGVAPDYPDTDAALRQAPDAAERYRLLYVGRKLRVSREAELNTVIEGCK